MKELTQKIVEAFKQTGFLAIQEDWGVACQNGIFEPVGMDKKCCAFGVLLLNQPCVKDPTLGTHIDDQEIAIQMMLGLEESYTEGFIVGFDGGDADGHIENILLSWKEHKTTLLNIGLYREGHQDGWDTWRALREEKLVWSSESEIGALPANYFDEQ